MQSSWDLNWCLDGGLLFPHMWVWGGQAREVCGQCGTQSALIYFLHLLWFLQHGPEKFLEWSMVLGRLCLEPAVSALAGDHYGPVGLSGKEHSQPPSAIVMTPHSSWLTWNQAC